MTSKGLIKTEETSLQSDVKKEQAKLEFRRNVKVGAILRKIHKEQGTMPYLLQVIEPYLTKTDRKFFGFPF